MIDIIIPAYNSHETIIDTLMSIAIQTYKENFKVYICNDKSDRDYIDIINRFNGILDITELDLEENSGPGVARQVGINNSNSEFIVFIDSDDMLYTPEAIKVLYDTIVEENADIVIGNFKEETVNGMFEHINDFTWLHGKIYRRQFLEDHNIHFNNSRNNEDNFFNKSLFMRDPNMVCIDDFVYLWKNNEESITRRNNHEYEFSGYFDLIDNLIEVVEDAINDNLPRETICEYTFGFMLTVYFFYLQYHSLEESKILMENSRKLKELYDMYKLEDKDTENRLYLDHLNHYIETNNFDVIRPFMTFEEFLKLYD